MRDLLQPVVPPPSPPQHRVVHSPLSSTRHPPQVACQRLLDFLLSGRLRRHAPQQRRHAHDEAGGAEAALAAVRPGQPLLRWSDGRRERERGGGAGQCTQGYLLACLLARREGGNDRAGLA